MKREKNDVWVGNKRRDYFLNADSGRYRRFKVDHRSTIRRGGIGLVVRGKMVAVYPDPYRRKLYLQFGAERHTIDERLVAEHSSSSGDLVSHLSVDVDGANWFSISRLTLDEVFGDGWDQDLYFERVARVVNDPLMQADYLHHWDPKAGPWDSI